MDSIVPILFPIFLAIGCFIVGKNHISMYRKVLSYIYCAICCIAAIVSIIAYCGAKDFEHRTTTQYNQAQVTYTDYEPEYIGNRKSYKFHYAWCSSVDDMYEGNKVYDKSRDYLISHGYVPCKRCDP